MSAPSIAAHAAARPAVRCPSLLARLGALVAAVQAPAPRPDRAPAAPAARAAALGRSGTGTAGRPVWDAPAHWLRPAEGWWTSGES